MDDAHHRRVFGGGGADDYGTTTTNGTMVITSCSTATITYIPDADFTGTDSFDYTLPDGYKTAIGTVNIHRHSRERRSPGGGRQDHLRRGHAHVLMQFPRLDLTPRRYSDHPPTICRAISLWHPMASMVMIQPCNSSRDSNWGIAAISLEWTDVRVGPSPVGSKRPRRTPDARLDGLGPVMTSSQGLAIHRHYLTLGQLGNRFDAIHEARPNLLWVQAAEHSPECVMRRDAVGQGKKPAQPFPLGVIELLHFQPVVRAANHRADVDHDDIKQLMPLGTLNSRVRQTLKVFGYRSM